jgi:Arc/MetJ-type ribon-helix-helix transcriptional regulator
MLWEGEGLPKAKKPYENVGIQRQLYEEMREFVGESGRYRSVSEFVHEAVRLRLEQLTHESKPKTA